MRVAGASSSQARRSRKNTNRKNAFDQVRRNGVWLKAELESSINDARHIPGTVCVGPHHRYFTVALAGAASCIIGQTCTCPSFSLAVPLTVVPFLLLRAQLVGCCAATSLVGRPCAFKCLFWVSRGVWLLRVLDLCGQALYFLSCSRFLPLAVSCHFCCSKLFWTMRGNGFVYVHYQINGFLSKIQNCLLSILVSLHLATDPAVFAFPD